MIETVYRPLSVNSRNNQRCTTFAWLLRLKHLAYLKFPDERVGYV